VRQRRAHDGHGRGHQGKEPIRLRLDGARYFLLADPHIDGRHTRIRMVETAFDQEIIVRGHVEMRGKGPRKSWR
jgi:hypothetical protein